MDRAFPYRAKAVKKLLRENKASKSSTCRKDPRTSTRLRNAGARESRFGSYQNAVERLLTCAMPSSRIIGLWDSSWTHANLRKGDGTLHELMIDTIVWTKGFGEP